MFADDQRLSLLESLDPEQLTCVIVLVDILHRHTEYGSVQEVLQLYRQVLYAFGQQPYAWTGVDERVGTGEEYESADVGLGSVA